MHTDKHFAEALVRFGSARTRRRRCADIEDPAEQVHTVTSIIRRWLVSSGYHRVRTDVFN